MSAYGAKCRYRHFIPSEIVTQQRNILHTAASGLVQECLFLPGTEDLHLVRENRAEKQTPGSLCFFRGCHIGRHFPLSEEIGEDPAHANIITPNFFVGKNEIFFRGKTSSMFGRPASFSRRLWRKVIKDGVMPGIADHIQIRILVYDTRQLFFCIPAVQRIITFFCDERSGITCRTMLAASSSLDISFFHMRYPRGTAR